MYHSLVNSGAPFHLYIFAFDDQSFRILGKMNLSHATVIALDEFEDEKLRAVKPSRTKAEYCWTCTPSTIAYTLEKFNVPECTYLDADLYFYSDPEVLFKEMGEQSVLLTEHRYPPGFNRTSKSGRFCVQFITFKNNEQGLTALYWWRDRCLEWCYNRYEDGKFGDQKYLDDWQHRFKGIHVLEHPGGGLAPWNVEQYKFESRDRKEVIFSHRKTGVKFKAVFYHFHHVRFFNGGIVDLGWRHPTMPVVINLYAPYIQNLLQTEEEIKMISKNFEIKLQDFKLIKNDGWKDKLKFCYKKYCRFNIFKVKHIISQYNQLIGPD